VTFERAWVLTFLLLPLAWALFEWRRTRRVTALVLKTLSQVGPLHGYGIVLHIQRASDELLNVEEGSLYPALHRMEQNGWVRSEWSLTETGRRAKYYKLTPVGRKQLEEAEKSFEQLVKGVRAILRYA